MINFFVPTLAQDLIHGMIDVNPGTRVSVSGKCEGLREEWEMILLSCYGHVLHHLLPPEFLLNPPVGGVPVLMVVPTCHLRAAT